LATNIARGQGENSSTEKGKKWKIFVKKCKIVKSGNFTKLFPWSCFSPARGMKNKYSC